MLHRKYRRKVVSLYELYQYPIQFCKYPIGLTFKCKYPITQKAYLFLVCTFLFHCIITYPTIDQAIRLMQYIGPMIF